MVPVTPSDARSIGRAAGASVSRPWSAPQPEEACEMALFGQQPKRDDPAPKLEPRVGPPPPALMPPAPPAPPLAPPRRVEVPMSTTNSKVSESIVAAGLTIEGKIEGNGNIR